MSSPVSEQKPIPRPLVDAWRAARPVAPELQRGYSRFLRRRAPRRAASTFARWLVGGVLLGAGLAQAASSQPWRAWTDQQTEATASVETAASTARPRSIAPQPSLPVAVSTEPAQDHSPEAPAAPPRVISAPASNSAAIAADSHAREQWRMAAEGLRTGNSTQAEGALLDLEQSASGGEREAAKLARAQLLSRSGRRSEAAKLAAELERSASSHVVRDKARELHQSLLKAVEADRSGGAGLGINQP